jgi:hypothetical protein
MKEQIEKILNNKSACLKGWSETGHPIYDTNSDKAQEITDHVFQFIEWIQEENWSKYKKLNWWVKKDNKIPPRNPPLTLNELYKFWYNNVFLKTKKE